MPGLKRPGPLNARGLAAHSGPLFTIDGCTVRRERGTYVAHEVETGTEIKIRGLARLRAYLDNDAQEGWVNSRAWTAEHFISFLQLTGAHGDWWDCVVIDGVEFWNGVPAPSDCDAWAIATASWDLGPGAGGSAGNSDNGSDCLFRFRGSYFHNWSSDGESENTLLDVRTERDALRAFAARIAPAKRVRD